jgi:hypothetical protein
MARSRTSSSWNYPNPVGPDIIWLPQGLVYFIRAGCIRILASIFHPVLHV